MRIASRCLAAFLCMSSSVLANIYEAVEWSEVKIGDGVTVMVSAAPDGPHLIRVAPASLPYNSYDAVAVYDALFDHGLKHRSEIGLQDQPDGGLLVWGAADTLSGRRKYIALMGDAGFTVFSTTSGEFNPVDALRFFPGITQLASTGSFEARLSDAGVDRTRNLAAPLARALPAASAMPAAIDPAEAKISAWPKPKSPREAAATQTLRAAFPGAIAPPPMFYKTDDGKTLLVLYHELEDGFLFTPSPSPASPKFGNFKTKLPYGGDVDDLFSNVMERDLKLKVRTRSGALEAPEWRTMHGARYWVEYGDAVFKGQDVRYCIYLYHNTLRLILAPPGTFASWGGPIAPLFFDGQYIKDPGNMTDQVRRKMGALSVEDHAKLHAIIVERTMQNHTFAFAAILNGSIMQMLNNGINAEFGRSIGTR